MSEIENDEYLEKVYDELVERYDLFCQNLYDPREMKKDEKEIAKAVNDAKRKTKRRKRIIDSIWVGLLIALFIFICLISNIQWKKKIDWNSIEIIATIISSICSVVFLLILIFLFYQWDDAIHRPNSKERIQMIEQELGLDSIYIREASYKIEFILKRIIASGLYPKQHMNFSDWVQRFLDYLIVPLFSAFLALLIQKPTDITWKTGATFFGICVAESLSLKTIPTLRITRRAESDLRQQLMGDLLDIQYRLTIEQKK